MFNVTEVNKFLPSFGSSMCFSERAVRLCFFGRLCALPVFVVKLLLRWAHHSAPVYLSSILCPKDFFGVASSDSLRWIQSCLTGFLRLLPISFPSSLRQLLPWVSRSLCLFSFHRGGHFDKTKRYSNICQRNLRNLVSIE